MCERTEDSPSAAEKVPDCDVLLEPTLLGALRGDGSAVSLFVFFYQRVSYHMSFVWFWVELLPLFNQFSLLKNWSLQLVGLSSHFLPYICLYCSTGHVVNQPSPPKGSCSRCSCLDPVLDEWTVKVRVSRWDVCNMCDLFPSRGSRLCCQRMRSTPRGQRSPKTRWGTKRSCPRNKVSYMK